MAPAESQCIWRSRLSELYNHRCLPGFCNHHCLPGFWICNHHCLPGFYNHHCLPGFCNHHCLPGFCNYHCLPGFCNLCNVCGSCHNKGATSKPSQNPVNLLHIVLILIDTIIIHHRWAHTQLHMSQISQQVGTYVANQPTGGHVHVSQINQQVGNMSQINQQVGTYICCKSTKAFNPNTRKLSWK